MTEANSFDVEEFRARVIELFAAGRDAEGIALVYSSVNADDPSDSANAQAAREGFIALAFVDVGRPSDALLAIARGIAVHPAPEIEAELRAQQAQIQTGY